MIVVAIVVVVFAFSSASHRSTIPKDYTLPNDNFDAATMQRIQTDFSQYQVAQTPQDHEVYMVSGGLGVANPRIMGWDSRGNMIFGFNGPPGTTFEILETGQNPMTWKTVIPHGKPDRKTKRGVTFTYKPLHWIKQVTKTGQTFYKLDDSTQAPQYFFKKGDTYILVIPFPGDVFPTGLMNHWYLSEIQ
ncbi:MAG: hypothetical protein K6T83_09180 [Alicyclobacillus sp.]|nr:hypothetical protein [Alicyclobacillus sp.]